PRAAGAFPQFLRVYAKECGLSLPEALFRITALPARRLGLSGKGTLCPGADADLVLFDPDCLKDRADFQNPVLPPEGIHAVFLAGRPAVLDGRIVNGTLGRAIRK
ncbi:MAG: amidohydrolase family protein, partial [Oscillospiraceae bacterium]|nr:amidohydrolase family protein [Oscillospiraceae bacterium]